jgi:hypothetical protein
MDCRRFSAFSEGSPFESDSGSREYKPTPPFSPSGARVTEICSPFSSSLAK